ncbi:His-Xaa-Ser system protein HxsD [Candidatus Parcubacteria bacterium]|nr:His-Xaa-Ser system protein HxsD [Candidatus Parcubacteria bacterium]MCG2700799.1 His-Xaa-Ser system protein HxsD [Candidatus Parcubacteria bacterium]
MKFKINSQKNQIAFFLNSKFYDLESVYGAAYVFLDRAYVFLDGDPKKEIIVYLKGKEKISSKGLEALRGEFYNELLNYLLRVKIAKRNKKIREYIVQCALLSAVGATAGETDEDENINADYKDDPLGIAVPWKEKK